MKLVERNILERLINEAKTDGFRVVRFASARGEVEDSITGDDLALADCVAYADAEDSDHIIKFSSPIASFWVLLVWGNDEDVISDYRATAEADTVINRVYAWIEG